LKLWPDPADKPRAIAVQRKFTAYCWHDSLSLVIVGLVLNTKLVSDWIFLKEVHTF